MGENSATPRAISNILTEVSLIDDFSMKSARLDFYVHLLQEEMRKMDAFKRELPQCMNLVQDVIEVLQQESLKWKTKQSEKKNWLASAKLWSTNPDSGSVDKYHQQQGEGSGIGTRGQGSTFQSRGMGFVPFKRVPNVGIQIEEEKASPPPMVPVDGLSLPLNNAEPIELNAKKDYSGFVRAQELHEMYAAEDQHQQHKKQRRCWSPELHKLFVDALNQLGGHKCATPKMIRELMRVDGLTNDEVKSHLQKYRLHVKKHASSSAGPSKFPSWLDRNRHVDLNKAGSSISPQSPFRNGSGQMTMGSGTAGESVDEDAESHGWMPQVLRASEKWA